METALVDLPTGAYSITIGGGVRDRIAPFVKKLSGVDRCVIITDHTVSGLHLPALTSALSIPHFVAIVPDGEDSKSLTQAAQVYDRLAAERVERSDLIIALGGGVVGDLAGFVAGTWMRGIRFIQVPTTIEAAVDASVGGKTGVNHPRGKNLIGVFYQPSAVFIDTDLLATLPDRDFRAGLAESIKHGLIRDPALLTWHEQNAARILSRDADALTHLIAANCRIKAEVVVADERESGLRAILNHGHTIGHAIEHALAHELRHGECVGLGMIAENHIAAGRGWPIAGDVQRIIDGLAALGLPTRLPRQIEADDIYALCLQDKKVAGGQIRFQLLEAVGRPVSASDVTADEIGGAVAAIAPVSSA
jgi:3-dehydroquinate synthase